MTSINHENIVHSMQKAAMIAGDIIRDSTPEKRVNLAGYDDLITAVDLETDQAIRDTLCADFPAINILTEETCKSDPAYQPDKLDNFTGFLVDPIDGSVNFSRLISPNYGNFAVSIGYCESGFPVAGIIYKPLEQEMYRASRGKGAFCNDIPIAVSEIDSLNNAAVEVGSFWIREEVDTFQRWFLNRKTDVSQILIRGSAAAALADVARGRIEAMLHSRLNAWDYAAGWVIIEEAGGVVMDGDTSPLTLGSRFIYATNFHLHDTIAKIILNDS